MGLSPRSSAARMIRTVVRTRAPGAALAIGRGLTWSYVTDRVEDMGYVPGTCSFRVGGHGVGAAYPSWVRIQELEVECQRNRFPRMMAAVWTTVAADLAARDPGVVTRSEPGWYRGRAVHGTNAVLVIGVHLALVICVGVVWRWRHVRLKPSL